MIDNEISILDGSSLRNVVKRKLYLFFIENPLYCGKGQAL